MFCEYCTIYYTFRDLLTKCIKCNIWTLVFCLYFGTSLTYLLSPTTNLSECDFLKPPKLHFDLIWWEMYANVIHQHPKWTLVAILKLIFRHPKDVMNILKLYLVNHGKFGYKYYIITWLCPTYSKSIIFPIHLKHYLYILILIPI